MGLVGKYLSQYAESESIEAHTLFKNTDNHFRQCVVIPVFDEGPACIERLQNHPESSNTLLILVINQPDTTGTNHNNLTLFNWLRDYFPIELDGKNLCLVKAGTLSILVVDRFRENNQIPIKQGVGLARKVGADIGCQLFHDGILQSDWIYSTDADAYLPDNYFYRASFPPNCCSTIFDFFHMDDETNIARATLTYEKAIKYYQRALDWAGSPYAFYTLGSTLAIKTGSYCAVRGFPKRAGGEDFYMLNKIAKVGRIHFSSNIEIRLESRLSHRIPFGTGPAVQSIINLETSQQNYCYYNTKIFIHLKQFRLWVENEFTHFFFKQKRTNSILFYNENTDSQKNNTLSSEVISVLEILRFDKFVNHAKSHCNNPSTLLRQFDIWFDGFKTLKFIHLMQAKYFPAMPIEKCCVDADRLFACDATHKPQ